MTLLKVSPLASTTVLECLTRERSSLVLRLASVLQEAAPRLSLARTQRLALDKGKINRRCTQRYLPGGLYALATLEAFSAIDLNSAPVQALTLLTCETAPVAEAAISAAMMTSGSSAFEMSRKSL